MSLLQAPAEQQPILQFSIYPTNPLKQVPANQGRRFSIPTAHIPEAQASNKTCWRSAHPASCHSSNVALMRSLLTCMGWMMHMLVQWKKHLPHSVQQ
jgi:hypothetical protein